MTACPFCQSPFVSFTGLAGHRRTYSCGASTWDSGIPDRSLTCHARELSLWKDLAAKLAESLKSLRETVGNQKNCKAREDVALMLWKFTPIMESADESLTAYNNLKNPTK